MLLDEADDFIDQDPQAGGAALKEMRALSEEGYCSFIVAGFWRLYEEVTFDYYSPLRNFGQLLTVGALEVDACRQLATKPMGLLNLRYAADDLVEKLVRETGQRANLLAIACNEIVTRLDLTAREITAAHVDAALASNAIYQAFQAWNGYSRVKKLMWLDRLIVYRTIGQSEFELADLMQFVNEKKLGISSEEVTRALQRLDLAFILRADGNRYSYRVPLFVKYIQSLSPERLLEEDLSRPPAEE